MAQISVAAARFCVAHPVTENYSEGSLADHPSFSGQDGTRYDLSIFERPISGATVLDPMCGSGVVLRQAASLGHKAYGFDIDPLAVLMSKVWTRKSSRKRLLDATAYVLGEASLRNVSYMDLPWISACDETSKFIEYWFSEPQRSALARMS